jgi:hypothetical protein
VNATVWICIGVTLFAIVRLGMRYTLAVASARWAPVPGRVVRSWVEVVHDAESTSYTPRVEYTYRVEGLIYGSTTMQLTGDARMYKRRATRVAAQYQPGEPVQVWHDPKRPERATLKTGGASGMLVGLVVVCVVGPALAVALSDGGRRVLGIDPAWPAVTWGVRLH